MGKHGVTCLISTAMTLIMASPAMAQANRDVDSGAQSSGIEDIVVTAQRREQSLQTVPVSVTALTAQGLEQSGIKDIGTLGAVTPGLVMSTSRASVTPYLRGVGTQAGDPGGSASVAIYVDGVYYQAPAAGYFSFNNIKRLEIIKGPQGTLFGRNATGGLIHIITRDPSHDVSGEASLGYGNFETVTGSFYVTGGLSDTLATDVSLYGTYQGKGFGKNLTIGGDVNFRREIAVRNKWLWTPAEGTRVMAAFDYSGNANDTGHVRAIAPGTIAIGNTPARGSIYDVQANLPSDVKAHQGGASLRIEQEIGGLSLASITAYRRVESRALFDQDATPVPAVDAVFGERTNTFQQEFTLNGKTDWLNYTAGLFYFYSSASTTPITIRSSIIAPLRLDRFANQKANSYAAFAQATASVTDSTRVTAGLRYTIDQISVEGEDIAVAGNPRGPAGSVIAAAAQKKTYRSPTWRVAIDQDLGERMLAYASYSRGYKTGQFNLNSFSSPAVRPEELDAYEIGFKTDIADRQLRLNVAGFLYKYRDIQLIQIIAGAPILFNAAAAKIKGADVEATWVPRFAEDRLQMRASVSYLDGHYSSFPNAPFFVQNPAGGLIQTTRSAAGNDTVRSPKWTANVTADYRIPASFGNFDLNATYFHSAKFNFDPDGLTRQGAYDQVNAQITFTANAGWYLRVWGRNLTDKVYYSTAAESTLGVSVAAAPPRTYGVTAGVKW